MDSYSHLEVEAALCVWEYLNDVTLLDPSRQDPQWVELREDVGSVALRHASIEIGKWALKVYDVCTRHDPSFFDGLAYDWEVIPAIVACCRGLDGRPAIHEGCFPSVEATAMHIARWALFEDYTSHVRHAFNKTALRPFSKFVENRHEEIEQAFADAVEPEDFVARLVALATAEIILKEEA